MEILVWFLLSGLGFALGWLLGAAAECRKRIERLKKEIVLLEERLP